MFLLSKDLQTAQLLLGNKKILRNYYFLLAYHVDQKPIFLNLHINSVIYSRFFLDHPTAFHDLSPLTLRKKIDYIFFPIFLTLQKKIQRSACLCKFSWEAPCPEIIFSTVLGPKFKLALSHADPELSNLPVFVSISNKVKLSWVGSCLLITTP